MVSAAVVREGGGEKVSEKGIQCEMTGEGWGEMGCGCGVGKGGEGRKNSV